MQELRHLLRDYNNDLPVKDSELKFIQRVADKDSDGCISQNEVLFAVSAWNAFNYMPKSAGAAFKKYQVGYGPLPSTDELRNFLEVLNDSQPVDLEEAIFVRRTAMSLGAQEQQATYEQMRKAVAVWYSHIERGQTSKSQLRNLAMADMKQNIEEDVTLLKGEFSLRSRSTRIMIVIVIIVFILVPISNIWLADNNHATYQCEHPHLDGILWWSGVMMMVFGVSILLTICVHQREEQTLKTVIRAICGITAVIVAMIEVFGVTHVMSSSMMRCGFLLWTSSQMTFFVLPTAFVMLILCGVPTLYYFELTRNQRVDSELRDQGP